jgi:hypothetical protein
LICQIEIQGQSHLAVFDLEGERKSLFKTKAFRKLRLSKNFENIVIGISDLSFEVIDIFQCAMLNSFPTAIKDLDFRYLGDFSIIHDEGVIVNFDFKGFKELQFK